MSNAMLGLRTEMSCPPSLIVPPRSEISLCSGRRSITGSGVCGSISVEFASARPRTFLANETIESWNPKQRPSSGYPLLPREVCGRNLALGPPLPIALREHYPVDRVEDA